MNFSRRLYILYRRDRDVNAQDAWNATYTQLEMQFDRASFDTWLRGAVFLRLEEGSYIIGVRHSYARDMLQHRLYRNIRRVLCDVTGDSTVELRFELVKAPQPTNEFDGADMPLFQLLAQQTADQSPAPLHQHVARPERPALPDCELNPRFTLSRFIFSGENPLLFPAVHAVIDSPGTRYNPLLVYGDVGLGKTHILHAIGHACQAKNLRVVYISTEAFTNDLIDAIRHRTTAMFRERYRSADVLLVDDIQFIAGKESTQEEFFHTFNALHMVNKQIVLASDRHPSLLDGVVDRLRSRFQSGLMIEVKKPELETRLAILRLWATERGIALAPSVAEMLANRAKNNVRELESVFNQVLATMQLTERPLTCDVAETALEGYRRPRQYLSVTDVLDITARYHGLCAADLIGKNRTGAVSQARQIAMYLAREFTSASLPQIGDAFGRAHSTVLHSCNKVAEDMQDSPALASLIGLIRQEIENAYDS
jgi:chromosomal replication initiator protein